MTWTYADPGASAKDAVRYEVGDTDTLRPLTSDEEITYMLAQEGNTLYAAAAVCSALAAKFSREADRTMGKTAVSASQRATAYRAQVKELRRRALSGAKPYAGGLTQAERETWYQDIDHLKGAFSKELHEDHLDLMPLPSTTTG